MTQNAITERQLLPLAHHIHAITQKAWQTPINSLEPLDAFANGVVRAVGPLWTIKSGIAEVLAVPVRAITGTSILRMEEPPQENFMHRGVLGFVGVNLSRGATFLTGAAGAGLGTLAGLVMRDTDSARKDCWAARGATVGSYLGFALQLPLEVVGSVANMALLAATYIFTLTFASYILPTVVLGVGLGCSLSSALNKQARAAAFARTAAFA